tara:strand:- start:69085 stop:69357 length:273 start_codon:yes stop_codon:yes gene_type:complete
MANRNPKPKSKEKKLATLVKKKPKVKTAAKGKRRSPVKKSLERCTPEQRHQLIAEAAYCLAEKHGFQCEKTLENWLQAEAEIDSRISIIS